MFIIYKKINDFKNFHNFQEYSEIQRVICEQTLMQKKVYEDKTWKFTVTFLHMLWLSFPKIFMIPCQCKRLDLVLVLYVRIIITHPLFSYLRIDLIRCGLSYNGLNSYGGGGDGFLMSLSMWILYAVFGL